MMRILLALLLAALCGVAAAQQIETITLRHRTAEQLMPQLRPLLEPGAALSGTGGKLFLRTSARNLADLRRVVEALDTAPRRLMISVRHGGERQADSRDAGISGQVSIGKDVRVYSAGRSDGAGVEVRRGDDVVRGNAYEVRTSSADRVAQRVQTIEGGRAWIAVGQSVPVPLRQTVVTPGGAIVSETVAYRDIGTGFYAEPRVSGDRVTLDISPTHDTPGATAGSANIQRLSTSVSGRLGEWIELGGTSRDVADDRAGTVTYSSRAARGSDRVWLKVEELP